MSDTYKFKLSCTMMDNPGQQSMLIRVSMLWPMCQCWNRCVNVVTDVLMLQPMCQCCDQCVNVATNVSMLWPVCQCCDQCVNVVTSVSILWPVCQCCNQCVNVVTSVSMLWPVCPCCLCLFFRVWCRQPCTSGRNSRTIWSSRKLTRKPR